MQRLNSGKILLPLAVAALLSACGGGGGSSGDDGSDGGQGTLNIDIQPDGIEGARVVVAGPSGVRNVTSDRFLTLDAGQYAISAVGLRQDRPIVDDVLGTVDKPAVTISDGQTVNVTANYNQNQPGAGRLWLPVRLDGQIHGFHRSQLDGTGAGSVTITGAGAEPINAVFDAGGNLWVAEFVDNTLLKYNAAQLAAPGGALVPDVIISTDGSGSLNGPVGLAFDARGNLWVGNFGPRRGDAGAGDNTLVRFTPQQLAETGQPTPRLILEGIDDPYGHAFDAEGNLWVAADGADNVVRFPPEEQVNDGTPDITITATTTGVLDGPRAPAFDIDGNLWVSSAQTSQVAGYSIDETGAATPLATVNLQNAQGAAVPSPDGLAFDNEGNLWVLGTDSNLYQYPRDDLSADGSLQPEVTISGFGSTRGVLFSFNPLPFGLPIEQ
jgi:sugar lactone lactonase YvrE